MLSWVLLLGKRSIARGVGVALEVIEIFAKLIHGGIEWRELPSRATLHDAAFHCVQDHLRQLLAIAVARQTVSGGIEPLPHAFGPAIEVGVNQGANRQVI